MADIDEQISSGRIPLGGQAAINGLPSNFAQTAGMTPEQAMTLLYGPGTITPNAGQGTFDWVTQGPANGLWTGGGATYTNRPQSAFSLGKEAMSSRPFGLVAGAGLGATLGPALWSGMGGGAKIPSLNMGGEGWEAYGSTDPGSASNWFSDADPGGFVNPTTGRVGPGLPGGLDYTGTSLYPNSPLDPQSNAVPGGPGSSNNLMARIASLFSGGGSTASGTGPFNPLSSVQSALSIGSGLYGLFNQNDLRRKADSAMSMSDPWGASGGRGAANAQLMALLNDPVNAAKNDPAYKLRLQAAARTAAPYGEGSGKMAIGAADASTDWYNQRLQQLGGLSGAGLNPAQGQQIGLEGNIAANRLSGDALASIGYGVSGATGATGGIPPAVLQWLQQMTRGQ